MGMNIKNPEAHALAREIAAKTGLSLTDAVLTALRDKRAALAGERREAALAETLLAYGRRLSAARAAAGGAQPRPSSDTSDLYDALGLPE
jgi:antitoxin VapB